MFLIDMGIYVIEFLENGIPKKRLIAPTVDDLANGVILNETFEGSGIMRARTCDHKHLDVPISHILSIDLFKVTLRPGWFGNGSRTVLKDENQVADIIHNTADSDTGEGLGISKIVNAKTKEVVYERDA